MTETRAQRPAVKRWKMIQAAGVGAVMVGATVFFVGMHLEPEDRPGGLITAGFGLTVIGLATYGIGRCLTWWNQD